MMNDNSEFLQLTQQLHDLYNELFDVQEAKHRPNGWWLDDLERLERFECELWEAIQNCEDEMDALSSEVAS